MRYSLLSVIVASTLALTACGNKQADNQAAGASATSSTATGATGSNKNAVFTITGAGASFPCTAKSHKAFKGFANR